MAGLLEITQTGKREDFADVIAMVDYKSTPFTSQCPKGSEPANTIYDWQMDAYDDPVLGGVIDGKDVIDTDYVNPGCTPSQSTRAYPEIQESLDDFGYGSERVRRCWHWQKR